MSLILSDNTFQRTWVDNSACQLPTPQHPGERIYLPNQRAIYEFDGTQWNLKYCNKSPMKTIEIVILHSGYTDWL